MWLDGRSVSFTHPGKDLVVEAPVTRGDRHVLQLTYSGTPEPVVAPTDRGDFETTGWTTTDDGSVWTMQEPYGAYSWYAVNDQPVRQGVLRPHHRRAEGDGGGRQRPPGVAEDGRRPHGHPLEPARAGGVVPDHDRDRPLHRDHRTPGRTACRSATGRRATGPAWSRGLRYTPEAIAYLEAQGRALPVPDAGRPGRPVEQRHGDPVDGHARDADATTSRATCWSTSSRTSGTATRSPPTTGATSG